jgi:hypothetical protein
MFLRLIEPPFGGSIPVLSTVPTDVNTPISLTTQRFNLLLMTLWVHRDYFISYYEKGFFLQWGDNVGREGFWAVN